MALHEANADLEQRLVVPLGQLAQNRAPGRIGQSVKHRIEVTVVAAYQTAVHVFPLYAIIWLHIKSASTATAGLPLRLVYGPKNPWFRGACKRLTRG